MDNSIQEQLNNVSSNGICKLQSGEFEGPFVIRKACTVKGSSTTLWSANEPVIRIEADNVYIKNLRLEITGNPSKKVSIDTNNHRVSFTDVEVDGDVIGVDGEYNWILPKTLNLGCFSSTNKNTFYFEIFVNTSVEIISSIDGLNFYPTQLARGINKIQITTSEFRDHTCIFGEVLLKSAFTRRIYVSGKAESNAETKNDFLLFKTDHIENINENEIISTVVPSSNVKNNNHISDGAQVAEQVQEETVKVDRGYRVSINETNELTISFSFESRNKTTVDPYLFMLKKDEKVINDNSLIFFGNKNAEDGSIEIVDNKIKINTKKILSDIEIVRLVFSVYNEEHVSVRHSFADISKILIEISNGKNYQFIINDVNKGESLVSLDIYKYKNEWKVKFIGSEYNKNIAQLCDEYGVNVD